MNAMQEHDLNPLDIYVGKKVRDFRCKVGWTLADLAERAGVSHQQVHKYEQGVTKISAGMLFKFSKIFSTTPNCFFEGFNPEGVINFDASLNDTISLKPKLDINLLVVEDSAADEFLLRKALEGCDYNFNLFCIHDGDEVMSFLRKKSRTEPFNRPDLILLDLNLPKVGGLSLLRTIKQDRDLLDIPVVVLTSSMSKADMIQAYRHHASGYISKSFDYEMFKKKLHMAIHYWVEAVLLPDSDMILAS